jgi:hypothetical protein
MKYLAILFTWLMWSMAIWGQSAQDTTAYCRYIEESSQAQGATLRAPVATAGVTPAQGTPPQLFLGLTDSVNHIREGSLTIAIGKKQCQLYKDSITVQERITFDMQALELDALRYKLTLINAAIAENDTLIAANTKILEAHNIPKQSIYLLSKQKLALETERQTTRVALANIFVPPLSTESLTELADAEFATNVETQKAQDKLLKLNNWDFQVTAGVEKPLLPFAVPTGSPYAGFTVTYNLGSHTASQHYNKSEEAYGDWKQAQVGDVMQSIQVYHKIVSDLVAVQSEELRRLKVERQKIADTSTAISGSDTSLALIFRNQLNADSLALNVQLRDTTYRLDKLNQYLRDNF